jgi:hypothetical protein
MSDKTVYVKLKNSWAPTKKYEKRGKNVENFGAFSIKAAVRGAYCHQCGQQYPKNSPPFWGVS